MNGHRVQSLAQDKPPFTCRLGVKSGGTWETCEHLAAACPLLPALLGTAGTTCLIPVFDSGYIFNIVLPYNSKVCNNYPHNYVKHVSPSNRDQGGEDKNAQKGTIISRGELSSESCRLIVLRIMWENLAKLSSGSCGLIVLRIMWGNLAKSRKLASLGGPFRGEA